METKTYFEFRTAKEPPILPPIVAIAMTRRIPSKMQKFLFRTSRIVFCGDACVEYGAAENGGGALRGASSQYGSCPMRSRFGSAFECASGGE
jgi:hypothetical protein